MNPLFSALPLVILQDTNPCFYFYSLLIFFSTCFPIFKTPELIDQALRSLCCPLFCLLLQLLFILNTISLRHYTETSPLFCLRLPVSHRENHFCNFCLLSWQFFFYLGSFESFRSLEIQFCSISAAEFCSCWETVFL